MPRGGKRPPFAPFEAPGGQLRLPAERLRKDYYHRWVHNPIRLDPNTKMPAFEREDGKTTITTVYDGDARKQFEAIWQYLLREGDQAAGGVGQRTSCGRGRGIWHMPNSTRPARIDKSIHVRSRGRTV